MATDLLKFCWVRLPRGAATPTIVPYLQFSENDVTIEITTQSPLAPAIDKRSEHSSKDYYDPRVMLFSTS
jgi:hypothetical protein